MDCSISEILQVKCKANRTEASQKIAMVVIDIDLGVNYLRCKGAQMFKLRHATKIEISNSLLFHRSNNLTISVSHIFVVNTMPNQIGCMKCIF